MDTSRPTRHIPTIGKVEPPAAFSYPLGNDPISAAFASLPFFDMMLLSFSITTPLLQEQGKITGYPLIRLTSTNYPVYQSVLPSKKTRRLGGLAWDIEVIIVPQEKHVDLQQRIVAQGLGLLHGWMTGHSAPKRSDRRKCVELWWFEDTRDIKLREVKPRNN